MHEQWRHLPTAEVQTESGCARKRVQLKQPQTLPSPAPSTSVQVPLNATDVVRSGKREAPSSQYPPRPSFPNPAVKRRCTAARRISPRRTSSSPVSSVNPASASATASPSSLSGSSPTAVPSSIAHQAATNKPRTRGSRPIPRNRPLHPPRADLLELVEKCADSWLRRESRRILTDTMFSADHCLSHTLNMLLTAVATPQYEQKLSKKQIPDSNRWISMVSSPACVPHNRRSVYIRWSSPLSDDEWSEEVRLLNTLSDVIRESASRGMKKNLSGNAVLASDIVLRARSLLRTRQ